MKRLALLALAAAGCFTATPPDGALACGAEPHACPPDYFCSDVGTCWHNGHPLKLQLSLVAGKLGGAGAADGQGAQARFNQPVALSLDTDGTLYVSDASNHSLRKLTPDGTVTTLIGAPPYGGSTDGTFAQALLNKPAGQYLDGHTLYLRDGNGIRIIDLSTGNVRTRSLAFSGDAAGLAIVNGWFWIADPAGSVVQVNMSTGATGPLTFPGFFGSPRGMAADKSNNLYVADRSLNQVMHLIIADSMITVEPWGTMHPGSDDGGVFSAQFSGPQAVALDGKGNLFVSDTFNCVIRKIDLKTKNVSTIAGTKGSCGAKDGPPNVGQLNWPEGLASDGNDTLYVADYLNHEIRKVTVSTGQIDTVAGMAATQGASDGIAATQVRFNSPARLAADDHGSVFISEDNNHVIRQYSLATGRVSTLTGVVGDAREADGTNEARFNSPQGIVYDGAGNLYVADGGGKTVRKIVIATAQVSTLAGIANTTGSADGPGAAATFAVPQSLALDGNGHLFVSDTGNGTIRRIDLASGMVTTPYGTTGVFGTKDGRGSDAHFSLAAGLAYYAGVLYVSDNNDAIIRQIDLASDYVSSFAGSFVMPGDEDGFGGGSFFRPGDLIADGRGNLFVGDNGNFGIRKLTIARGKVGQVSTLAGAGAQHRGIVQPGALPASLNAGLSLALLPSGGIAVGVASENALLMIR